MTADLRLTDADRSDTHPNGDLGVPAAAAPATRPADAAKEREQPAPATGDTPAKATGNAPANAAGGDSANAAGGASKGGGDASANTVDGASANAADNASKDAGDASAEVACGASEGAADALAKATGDAQAESAELATPPADPPATAPTVPEAVGQPDANPVAGHGSSTVADRSGEAFVNGSGEARVNGEGHAHAGNGASGQQPASRGGGTNGDAPNEVDAAINALWREFRERPNQRLRERLVLHYAPLVKYVAGRVGTGLPTHVDVGDLVQSGIFGLIDAIEKFDPDRGWRFETYAMQRIRGAILDDLRSQDWVPRVVRSRLREAERALERLGARLHRTPTDTELAEELGIGLDELRDLYGQLRLTSVVALEDLIAAGKDSGSLVDTLQDEDAVDPVAVLVDRDNRRQLAEAIAQLTERDRIVVSLYYFESLTLAEIGKVLGVTESRVSQLHTRAVLRLRARLTEQAGV
ncbi:RNA polymerase sigma factor, FliA/WhiG family [Amycolatopsis sacchari]|uniref:RNA polymerase sigma factor n=1 Tax=Amycolatopsis sacchari TaxID=115433 RepID=A0A1I3ZK78_9PSEU|nr:RNA polymerase sigma factor, FliA/WhiG family [Amycolatopsis sacchari]